ncbi:MAG: MFS transporter [Oscillospiraceae bacterium]|nr:MFS transporter [Oscillospiraceae bacterium]
MSKEINPSPRDFRLVVIGQIISIFGSSLLRFALSLYILDVTGSESLFAAMLALSGIPILLSPLGGAIADRFSRRDLMVIFDFTSSFIVLCLIPFMATGGAPVALIGAVMVLLAIVSALYFPSVTASIPQLVPEDRLAGANGVVQAVQAISGIAAPVCGGVLYGVFGVFSLVVISAAAFFLSAVMEIFIRIPFTKREQKEHIVPTIIKDMKDGFGYVIKHSFIWKVMILAALLNMIFSPLIAVGTPIILRVTMQSTDTMYGIGMGMLNVASILGALIMGLIGKKIHVGTTYRAIGALVFMLIPVAVSVLPFFLGLGYFPAFAMFMLGMSLIAVTATVINIFVITKVQLVTPNENLGKVMAIIVAAAQCAAPLGQIIYGVAFEIFSASLYIPIAAVGVLMTGLTVLSHRLLRSENR